MLGEVSIKNLFFLVLVSVGSLCAIELGLYFNYQTQSRIEKESKSGHVQKSILIIGDSVTGVGNKKYPYILEEKIMRQFPSKNIRIVNLSKPNLRTRDVKKFLQESIDLYNPILTLLMVGLSDSPGRINKEEERQVFGDRIKILIREYVRQFSFRFMNWKRNIEWWFFEQKLMSRKYLGLKNTYKLFWKGYEKRFNDYGENCIDIGRSLVDKNMPLNDRVLKGLMDCYIESQQVENGIVFFEKIKKISVHSRIVSNILEHLYLKRKQPDLKKTVKVSDKGLLNKYDYALQIHQVQSENEKQSLLNELFVIQPHPQNEKTKRAYREFLQLYQRNGKDLVFLQYPNSDVLALKKVFLENEKNLEVFDTRSALIQYSEDQGVSILSLFEEDFLHLSELGHKALGEELEKLVRKRVLGLKK